MENQRIRLTKKMLKDALLNLLQEKPIDQISVTTLCKWAEINRVTFYKYYNTPSDVLTEIQSEMMSGIEERLSFYNNSCSHLISALEFFKNKRNELIVLIKNVPGSELEELLFYCPDIRKILDSMLNSYSEEDKERAYLFICSGSYSIIRKWMIEGCHEAPESIASFIHSFASKLL